MIRSAVAEFFRSAGWELDEALQAVAQGAHATYGCVADADEDAGLLTFYVYSPSAVPPALVRNAVPGPGSKSALLEVSPNEPAQ